MNPSLAKTYETIIVGAGLAGLGCALTLQAAGRRVLVLEASDRAGGRLRTDPLDGFLLDHGLPGPPQLKLIQARNWTVSSDNWADLGPAARRYPMNLLGMSIHHNRLRKSPALIAFLCALGLSLCQNKAYAMPAASTETLFESPDTLLEWVIVNDSVMGGISRSSIELSDTGSLLFEGTLSLENRGGFASVRSRPENLPTDRATAFALSVRGDGRRYYFDLRSDSEGAAGSYRAAFDTVKDQWSEILIPIASFERQSFGRVLPQYRLDPGTITSIGFTLSDKKAGRFELEIASVKSVFDESARTEQTSARTAEEQAQQLIALAIQKGVPLFNEGNPEACSAIYEVTCRALVALPQVSGPTRDNLKQALAEAEAVPSAARQAWILRYALDDAFESLSQ